MLMVKVRSIMVIDDDRDDLRLFEEAIHDYNSLYRCVTVNSGVKALQMLSQETCEVPDIIFLDLRMPKLSGKKVLIELKQHPRLASIPVVILTTSIDVDEARELKSLGAVHFCSKPSDPAELYYVVSVSLEDNLV